MDEATAYDTFSDKELAEALEQAEVAGDTDEMIYVENEILGRLSISLDETEQGLTIYANQQIKAFCERNGVATTREP